MSKSRLVAAPAAAAAAAADDEEDADDADADANADADADADADATGDTPPEPGPAGDAAPGGDVKVEPEAAPRRRKKPTSELLPAPSRPTSSTRRSLRARSFETARETREPTAPMAAAGEAEALTWRRPGKRWRSREV
jgi:hypothetical protein